MPKLSRLNMWSQEIQYQSLLQSWFGKPEQQCRWGHKLAQGAPGKGHGSRAFLHTLRHGVTIHDASYWLALELSGPVASLVSLLASLW